MNVAYSTSDFLQSFLREVTFSSNSIQALALFDFEHTRRQAIKKVICVPGIKYNSHENVMILPDGSKLFLRLSSDNEALNYAGCCFRAVYSEQPISNWLKTRIRHV